MVDLQGIKKGTHDFLPTDPAIHTCNTRRLVADLNCWLLCRPQPLSSIGCLTCL